MPDSDLLAQASEAYDAHSWARAVALFAQAEELTAEDLDRFAVATMLTGDMEGYFALRERTYDQQVATGDLAGAALSAFWIGMQRMIAGDEAVGGGWLARAGRLVEEDGTDSIARAGMRIAQTFGVAASEGPLAAATLTGEVVADARRLEAPDFVALSLHQQGLFLLEAGAHEEGLAKLDEAMLELTSGRLSPMVTGIVFCGAVAGCWAVYELRRAQEWTAAMTRWCEEQPEMGNFTGECRVRRAELKQIQGAWADARVDLAGVSPADVDLWAAGFAAYLRGNLDRLQGRFGDAEDSFREAARLSFDPQPGLALLRLAQKSTEAAAAMVRRCLAEHQDDGKRVEVLVAAVEILLAVGDPEAAVQAAEELEALAVKCRTPVVRGLSLQAQAACHVHAGAADVALTPARAALRVWLEVPSPYEAARTRLLIADACRALGDVETADSEAAASREVFEQLGAVPDLGRLPGGPDGPLSPRELEVLKLLATGATNRAIAAQLVLSERTVDRHVSNIFAKLGVATRAAATAYAFEQQLL